jgi:hypothetical protein
MSKQSYRPSIEQGFNFQKDNQDLVGHITGLKIGANKFAADLAVQDPTAIDKGTKVKVVGIVSAIRWDGGFAQPITFTCQVGFANAKTAAVQTHQDLSDTSVELQYIIYKYDPKEKKYYQCFHSNKKDLKGLVEKNGGELEYEMDIENQNMQVPSPINFELYLSVMPQEEEQEVHLAVSVSDKLVKKWGVTGPGKG